MLGRLNLVETRLLIVGPNGAIVSDSQPDQAGLPLDLRSLTGQSTEAAGEVEAGGSTYLYNFTPLDQGSGLLLVTPRPRVRLGTLLGEDLLRPFFRAGLVALAVSVVLAWLMARWVAAPMERLADAARRVAAGDYRAPTDVRGPAEVLGLAAAFREMVDRVRAGQQAQRDFVANVSHELRTPLTSIQGFAQAIRDGAAGGREGIQRAGEVILEESERLKHLVEDLLDLARLDAGQLSLERSPMDLARVVERRGGAAGPAGAGAARSSDGGSPTAADHRRRRGEVGAGVHQPGRQCAAPQSDRGRGARHRFSAGELGDGDHRGCRVGDPRRKS